MAEEEQSKWVFCARCGYESRDHRILYEKRQEIYEDEPPCPAAYYEYHRLVECMGCKTIKYVISKTSNSLDNVPPSSIEETDLKVYPDLHREPISQTTSIIKTRRWTITENY